MISSEVSNVRFVTKVCVIGYAIDVYDRRDVEAMKTAYSREEWEAESEKLRGNGSVIMYSRDEFEDFMNTGSSAWDEVTPDSCWWKIIFVTDDLEVVYEG